MKKISNMLSTDMARREALLARIDRLTELPLLVLAFVMIPLLLGPLLWDLSSTEEATFLALDTFIWAIFAVDLGVKVVLAPKRLAYMRQHWLEVLVVVLPFARPLRLVRLFVFGSRAFLSVRRLTNVDFLLVYAIGLVIISATVVTSVEVDAKSTIDSFADALWWAMTTVTTVGYGDTVPVTAAGRAMGYILMVGGIAFFGGITANLASLLVRTEDPSTAALNQLTGEVQRLRQEILRQR